MGKSAVEVENLVWRQRLRHYGGKCAGAEPKDEKTGGARPA